MICHTILRDEILWWVEVWEDNFLGEDIDVEAEGYTEESIEAIMNHENVIRSPRKIRAIINNAKAFLLVQEAFGSFSSYLWAFTDFKTMIYPKHADDALVVARNELSDIISADLKKRGFSFLGSITVYAHLQAAGLINDHYPYCFRYQALTSCS